MVANYDSQTGQLSRNQLEHSIRQNFGGFNPETGFDPTDIFRCHCNYMDQLEMPEDGRPPVDSIGFLKSALSGNDTMMNV